MVGRSGFCHLLCCAVFPMATTLRAKQETEREKQKTEASLMIARSELARGSGNIEAAVAQAKSAFLSVPSAASRSQLLQAALEISPHAAAVLPLGADTIAEALGWAGGTELDFAVGSGRMRTLDLNAQSKDVAGWNLPVIKRPQEGNPAAIRALSALDGDRMIVVFDEGSIGLYRRGTHEIRVQPPGRRDLGQSATAWCRHCAKRRADRNGDERGGEFRRSLRLGFLEAAGTTLPAIELRRRAGASCGDQPG